MLEKYISIAIQNNLALKQQDFSYRKSVAALDEARQWGERNGALEVVAISSVANQGLDNLRHLLRRLYQGP